MSDGPHGIRRVPGGFSGETLPATCFPTASALAATWDVDLIRTMGEALADECIALGVDILLGPGNNLKRTPLCGRNFEYSLRTRTRRAHGRCLHRGGAEGRRRRSAFATNNQEDQRFTINAEVDERCELYRRVQYAVRTAAPWTVMCANRLSRTAARRTACC